MGERKIANGIEKQPYFEAVTVVPVPEQDDGTREMGELQDHSHKPVSIRRKP